MSKLKIIRESKNLTQEELSEQSGISVRTIQRIESGQEPKGYTLRVLAQALGREEKELKNQSLEFMNQTHNITHETEKEEVLIVNYTQIKIINISSLPFIIIPLMNIIVPLLLAHFMKVKSPIIKQIVSLQIIWTILAPIVFMLGIFLKLGNQFTLVLMVLIVLSNVYLILSNTAALDRKQTLRYKLNFSIL